MLCGGMVGLTGEEGGGCDQDIKWINKLINEKANINNNRQVENIVTTVYHSAKLFKIFI